MKDMIQSADMNLDELRAYARQFVDETLGESNLEKACELYRLFKDRKLVRNYLECIFKFHIEFKLFKYQHRNCNIKNWPFNDLFYMPKLPLSINDLLPDIDSKIDEFLNKVYQRYIEDTIKETIIKNRE